MAEGDVLGLGWIEVGCAGQVATWQDGIGCVQDRWEHWWLVGIGCREAGWRAEGNVPQSGVWGPMAGDDALVVVEDSDCGGIKEGGASMVTVIKAPFASIITSLLHLMDFLLSKLIVLLDSFKEVS